MTTHVPDSKRIVPEPIERYLASLNRAGDDVLAAVAEEGRIQQLPLIDAEVGALLHVLARAVAARRILEIGTAIGYSGIWLARALGEGGLFLTIERNPERAAAARRNFETARLADRATVMVGDAMRAVQKVAGPFDLIFNDGDKLQYEPLLDRLVSLLRPGGLLVTDNVLRGGKVAPGFGAPDDLKDELVAATVRYNERLAGDARLITSIIPLRDGLSISVRK